MGKSTKDVGNLSRTHLGKRRSSAASPMMGSPGTSEIERRDGQVQIEMSSASERSGSSSPGVTRPSCNGGVTQATAGQVHASL